MGINLFSALGFVLLIIWTITGSMSTENMLLVWALALIIA